MSTIRLDGNDVKLTGKLDLVSLMSYKREVEKSFPEDGSLSLDLSELEFEGSAVLALLVHIARRARTGGGRVQFVGASDRLVKMASLAELDELLGLTA